MDVSGINLGTTSSFMSSSGASSGGKSSSAKQVENLKKQMENYKKELSELDGKEMSKELKSEKKKALQQKIKDVTAQITKIQAEQVKETLNKPMKVASGNKNMSKEDYEAKKLMEAGVYLDLSKDMAALGSQYKSEYALNNKSLENDKDREGNTSVEASDIVFKHKNETSDDSPEFIATMKTMQELINAVRDGEEHAEMMFEKFMYDFEHTNFDGPHNKNEIKDHRKAVNAYNEHKTLWDARKNINTKISFLEKLVAKGELAIENLENSQLGKVAKAAEIVSDIDRSSDEEAELITEEVSDAIETAPEDRPKIEVTL